jgi:acetylornithine/succinyldiaminopimelate/putrescine aminotransferase
MAMASDHLCNNYVTHSIVVERAKGCHIWDPEGNKYLDFIAGVAACSQGHCHPKIVEALTK